MNGSRAASDPPSSLWLRHGGRDEKPGGRRPGDGLEMGMDVLQHSHNYDYDVCAGLGLGTAIDICIVRTIS